MIDHLKKKKKFLSIWNKHKRKRKTTIQDVCFDLLAAETDSRAGKIFIREERVEGHLFVRQFPTETVT